MKENGYPLHLIAAIKSTYLNTSISLDINGNLSTDKIYSNKGVRQGCCLSPTLFNIYIDDIIKLWKKKINVGFKINKNTLFNIILYADDIALVFEKEDDLQRGIYQLNMICKTFDMNISTQKTKVMAFSGKQHIRTKIVVNNQTLEQVNHFNYLGCDISYGFDKDIQSKVSKFGHICGSIDKFLRNKTTKETRLKFYKTVAVPTLMHGSESWVTNTKHKQIIQTAEMKFLRSVKRCSRLDRIRNENIREELKIYNLNERIEENREKWKEHLNRMENERIPKIIRGYRPKGKRSLGRPRKR